MDNRPIKGNSNGKYNMNFIDPTNDICSYYGGNTELEHLVEQYLTSITYTKKLQINLGNTFNINKKIKDQNNHLYHQCSVCLQKFKQGQQVKILPCKHCFHKHCVIPWFQTHDKCPNCRFSLAKQQVQKNQG